MRRQMKWFNALFLVAGILCLVLTVFVTNRTLRLQRDGVTAPGHVIRLVRGSKGSYFPVVEFQAQDQQRITFKSQFGNSPPAFREGEAVTVLYDPLDPQRASIQSFGQMWGASLISGTLGLLFTAIPTGIMLVQARTRKRDEWLRQFGQRITTQFDRVERNTSIRMNAVSPYRIFSRGQNPFTAQLEVFHSENIWFDPTSYVCDRSIDVLIDPNNPKRYWLDTGFLPTGAE